MKIKISFFQIDEVYEVVKRDTGRKQNDKASERKKKGRREMQKRE